MNGRRARDEWRPRFTAEGEEQKMSVLTAGAPPRPAMRYQLDTSLADMTPAERAERGKTARAEVPRESHAEFDPPSDRPDPLGLLEEQAEARVPELVPIRWGRMMVSPFTYYRGAALPMASDLAITPVSGLAVQACGDAHLSNFGVFGSAERRLVFDVNDFDETLPGPWEWDVKRLAASLEVAGRENGFSTKQRRDSVMASVSRYREALRQFAGMKDLDVWYAAADVTALRAQVDAQLQVRQRKALDKGLTKARTRDSMRELARLTQMVNGRPRIISDPPLLVPVEELIPAEAVRADLEGELANLVGKYQRTLETDRRYLLQQFEFCDRQLRDWKFSVEVEVLRPEGLQMYAALCGWTLARAHARSGDRIAIGAYLGGSDVFDRAIAKFAVAYADQNERDHQALIDAVKSGRII